MKKMLLLATICLGATCLSAQTYSKDVEEQIRAVENGLAGRVQIEGKETYNILDRMAHYKVKGLSVAVVQNYKVVWAKGYGWADEGEKRPVTSQTIFEPGSISKSLNAVGILKLLQDKKLDLYTDINTYLKSWKFPYDTVSHNKKITLANLLSHTAGLTVHGFPGYDRKSKIPTVPEILDGKKPANTDPVRSAFEPGLRFQYSGGGTTISQLILTDVSQMPYDKFMRDNVLGPLGMDNSFYSQPPPASRLSQVATGYHADGSAVGNKFHVYPEQGAAGLWTTPVDLCKYIIETQLAYEGKSAKVLNQEMTKLRLTPYIDPGSAFGVFIEERGGIKYFAHNAANEGFMGMYYGSLEEGNGLAIFINSEKGDIMPELANSIATVYKWKDFYNPVKKKEVTVPESILDKYVGFYRAEGMQNTFANIVKKDDGYYLLVDGQSAKMYFSSETEFFNMEFATEKHFLSDDSGNITGYYRTLNGKELPKHVRLSSPDTLTGNEEFFNAAGWSFLENKKYNEAIGFFKRGMALHPNSLLIEGNLAHAYLFSNNYDAAIKIYKAHMGQSINPHFTWTDMIKQDFVYFKNIAFDKKVMDKVFSDLKTDVPEDYKSK